MTLIKLYDTLERYPPGAKQSALVYGKCSASATTSLQLYLFKTFEDESAEKHQKNLQVC